MARPIGSTLVAHLPDFLDENGEVAQPSLGPRKVYEAQKVGLQLARIVEAATAHPAEDLVETALPCPRRPDNAACAGRFFLKRSESEGTIYWMCPGCGDNGDITGWEGTRFDLREHALGDDEQVHEVRMPDEVLQAVQGEARLDPRLRRLVAAATIVRGDAVLCGTAAEMRRLLQDVDRQVHDERSYRRRRIKEQALAALTDLPEEARAGAAVPALRIEVVAERLPRELARLVTRQGAVVDQRELLTQLKARIDGALVAESIGHRHMGMFIQTLHDVAEEISRAGMEDPAAALAAYAYFLDALPRMHGHVDDETEMQTFCTCLCCDAIGHASRLEEPLPETAALINSLLKAFARDEEYWFDCVPDLVRALEFGSSGRSWLLDTLHEHMPARDSGHQEEMERIVADLGG